MSVRKRIWKTTDGKKKEAWIVTYTDQDDNRRFETFQKKKDADARHDKVRTDVRSGIYVPANANKTVAAIAEEWLIGVKAQGREESTLYQYRQHVKLHINPRIGRIKLAKLTTANIKSFRNDLVEDGGAALSRPLARKVLTSLKSLLKAADHGHVGASVSFGRGNRDERRKVEVGDIPTPAEIRTLIGAAATDSKRKALLMTAVFTGLRASELRGLRWCDVNLKEHELNVRQRADRWNVIGAPKSRTSVRSIPLPPDLVEALKMWKAACPLDDHGEKTYVFPTKTGRIDHHKSLSRGLQLFMKTAGVVNRESGEAKYALHAFRHFFASWCINPKDRGGREMTVKVVSTLMGHSSIVITLDLYGHLFPRGDDRAELQEAAAALLRPSPHAVVPLPQGTRA